MANAVTQVPRLNAHSSVRSKWVLGKIFCLHGRKENDHLLIFCFKDVFMSLRTLFTFFSLWLSNKATNLERSYSAFSDRLCATFCHLF